MIRVVPKSPPSDFDTKVKQPGLAFLASQGIVTNQEVPSNFPWKTLWLQALEDLYDDYGGICAYMGMRMEFWVAGVTVDHFHHKQNFPMLAYEWSNYRLAASRFNSRKSTFQDVLDPFEIEDGWFEIDFSSGKVKPGSILKDSEIRAKVLSTINRLKLNELRLRKKRTEWFDRVFEANSNKKVGMDVLSEDAPFIHAEILRQGFQTP